MWRRFPCWEGALVFDILAFFSYMVEGTQSQFDSEYVGLSSFNTILLPQIPFSASGLRFPCFLALQF